MDKIKLFEQFINENLFQDRAAETYFWLRCNGGEEGAVTDFVLAEFNLDADDMGDIIMRYLDDQDYKGTPDEFVSECPEWFMQNALDKDPSYKEVQKFNQNAA